MSKRKMARFKLKNGETLIKKGMMDYCVTGGYGHSAMGDAFLTDQRFYFSADLKSGEFLYFELPLGEIHEIKKTGIPVLTRSILLIADGRPYRLNVFPMRGWLKKLRTAVAAFQKEQT